MRLLIITEGYYPHTGGLEKIVTEVAENLVEKNSYDVTVFTATREKVKPYRDEVNGVRVYYMPVGRSHGKLEFVKELFHARAALKKVLSEQFDFVSIQYMGYFSALFSTIKTSIPYSISIHGTDVIGGKQGVLVKFIQKRIVHRSKTVISNSYYLAKELEKKLSVSIANKLEVIWNGIDLDKYKMAEELTTERVAVSVGRFAYKKGFDILIEAFATVVNRFSDACLLIAGDGDERKKCEEVVKDYGIEKNVQFLGLVPNTQIGEVFSKGRVFVCPSRNESFGIVVLEAMAMGIPVIATDSGGVSEIIDNNKYGYTVPIEDPEALAGKMIHLFENMDECNVLRKKGLDRVKEFTLENVVEKYDETIQGTFREKL